MMSLEIEPQYLAHDEDASENGEQNESSAIAAKNTEKRQWPTAVNFRKLKEIKSLCRLISAKERPRLFVL